MTANTEFLAAIGWDEAFQASFDALSGEAKGLFPGRVIGQGKGHYQVLTSSNTTVKAAVVSRFHKAEAAGFPTVGDWVAISIGVGKQHSSIHHVLTRKSLIQRRRSGRRSDEMQLIAANVDCMLVFTSMNEDFDLPRIGRYVSLSKNSNCKVAVVLTKADLADAPDDYVRKTTSQFPDLEVYSISNTEPSSLAVLDQFFKLGSTTVLVGSSGVGKSSFTNYLLGFDAQKTQDVSFESRGRHTTTTRDLRITRFGGVVIDTPGMQEIADQTEEDDVSKSFADIEMLELQCKFTNCQHGQSPGCAITRAIEKNEVSSSRVKAYLDLKNQMARKR